MKPLDRRKFLKLASGVSISLSMLGPLASSAKTTKISGRVVVVGGEPWSSLPSALSPARSATRYSVASATWRASVTITAP